MAGVFYLLGVARGLAVFGGRVELRHRGGSLTAIDTTCIGGLSAGIDLIRKLRVNEARCR